jgi:hypothetical protein
MEVITNLNLNIWWRNILRVANLFAVLTYVLSTFLADISYGYSVANDSDASVRGGDTADAGFIASLLTSHEQKLLSFSRVLMLPPPNVVKVLAQCPQLLRQSMERETLPHIQYLCDALRIGRPALGRVVVSYPAVLASCVQKNSEHVIRFLLEFGVDHDQLKKILRKRPQLLALRVETNLRPTVEHTVPA